MRVSSCKNCGTSIIWLPKNDGSDRWNPPLNAESAQSGYCVVNGRVEFTYMYSKHTCTVEQIQSYQLILNLRDMRDNTFRHMDGTPAAVALDKELDRQEAEQRDLNARQQEERDEFERAEAEREQQRKQAEAEAASARRKAYLEEREAERQAAVLKRKVKTAHAEAIKENTRREQDAAAKAHAEATPRFSDVVPQMQYNKHYGNLPADVTTKMQRQPQMNWEDMKALQWADALKHVCPTCSALPGERCKSMALHLIKRGVVQEVKSPHKPRLSDHWFETEENM